MAFTPESGNGRGQLLLPALWGSSCSEFAGLSPKHDAWPALSAQVFGVLLLSPLLRSLAATISEDSVLSLSCVALLLHLFLHDYHFVNSVTDRFSGAVALSSAVMASVLLASLMHSDLAAFAQVTCTGRGGEGRQGGQASGCRIRGTVC